MTRIGYYVHHQGAGHLDRALAIARHAPEQFTLIGSRLGRVRNEISVLELPDDLPGDLPDEPSAGADGHPDPAGCLHYAPNFHDGVRARVAILTGWIAECRPRLMVVDVSVEIAMLSRLSATPTVYFRLSGDRSDRAHEEAFRQADAVIAPFHCDLDRGDVAEWVRSKTFYAPGIVEAWPPRGFEHSNTILFVFGKGGSPGDAAAVLACARSCPEHEVAVIGPTTPFDDAPSNLTVLGWVDDAFARISQATVVVGGGGDGIASAVLAAGKPFVCIPEARPYGEQVCKARALARLGCAVVLDRWPLAGDWPGIIAAALGLDRSRCQRLADPHGAQKACEYILDVARQAAGRS